jgi:hypothetical protein
MLGMKMLRNTVVVKMTVFWVVAMIIALIIEAVLTSETSVSLYQTTPVNIPEDSHLHAPLREDIKSLCCSEYHQMQSLVTFSVPRSRVASDR